MNFASLVASLVFLALPAQQATETDKLVAHLREIANRETLTKDAEQQRSADAATWLQANAGRELGEFAILRAIANSCASDPATRLRSAADLVAFFELHEKLPAPGFEEPAGRVVLFDFVRLADAGKWDECRVAMPLSCTVNSPLKLPLVCRLPSRPVASVICK